MKPGSKNKSIEETYESLDQREHVLLRSDMYIGSTSITEQEIYVVDNYQDISHLRVVKKNVKFVPGFIKIFDEIITNSSDHYIKTQGKVKNIKVVFGKDFITVENDGPGIPVEMHKKENKYVPEMILFTLLAGSNFDDTEDRFVGGRNGLGAKLTNIYSTKFTVETADGKKKLVKTAENNLLTIHPAVVTASKQSFTRITYYPDFKRFGMKGFTPDVLAILTKRVLDTAAYCPNAKVTINDVVVPVKSIKDFMAMHLPANAEIFYEKLNDKWEIGIAQSPSDAMEQVSIVNGISTYAGGTHVRHVATVIADNLSKLLLKVNKKYEVKPKDIKDKLYLFVICKIPNPSFSSQTKEELKNTITKDIFDATISAALFAKVMKSQIVESIINYLELKKKQELAKLNKSLQKVKVEKLIDAKGKDRLDCILGLFEGDSALGAFRQFRDPNRMGAFPLRGKFINVSELTPAAAIKNEEVKNILSSLGLSIGEKVVQSNLRFGKIYLYTDADSDGNAISSSLINFFYKYWKELFEQGRIMKVMTPLMVCQKGNKKEYFYTNAEFDAWSLKNDVSVWQVEYKKGLGSLIDEEYRMIINNPYLIRIDNDEEAATNLDIWFGKDADKRKKKMGE